MDSIRLRVRREMSSSALRIRVYVNGRRFERFIVILKGWGLGRGEEQEYVMEER